MIPSLALPRRRLLLSGLALGLGGLLAGGSVPAMAEATADDWIVDASTARALLAEGALLLDARSADLRAATSIPGATPVAWQDFAEPDLPFRGRLLADDAALTERLRALGVSAAVTVVVVADPLRGWGEDGRVVWTLRTLGHGRSVLVDGGATALLADGIPTVAPTPVPGDFTIARTATWDVGRDELAALIGRPDVVILDTREPREFAGETPYGEARGGHIPGARHVWFRDLVGPDGRLLAGDDLRARLAALGVSEETEVISYCTGGIRSGFVTAVLSDMGLRARNYAGSMWEWSVGDPAAYPLVTD